MNTISCYQIGDFPFLLEAPEALKLPENLALFQIKKEDLPEKEDLYTYTLVISEELPDPSDSPDVVREDMTITVRNGLETRYQRYHLDHLRGPYACMKEDDPRHTTVYLRPWILPDLSYETVFCSLLSLEKPMIRSNALILHSACIRWNDSAIVFTAPSGTGKSTQAALWEKCRKAFQVNGDRTLLQKKDGRWLARGWPVCGSSGICHNLDTPLKAIVTLSQGPENTACFREPGKAFQELYSQITINRWNRDFQLKVMTLTEELISEIPVCHLSCTISEEAVRCLEELLSTM